MSRPVLWALSPRALGEDWVRIDGQCPRDQPRSAAEGTPLPPVPAADRPPYTAKDEEAQQPWQAGTEARPPGRR